MDKRSAQLVSRTGRSSKTLPDFKILVISICCVHEYIKFHEMGLDFGLGLI